MLECAPGGRESTIGTDGSEAQGGTRTIAADCKGHEGGMADREGDTQEAPQASPL